MSTSSFEKQFVVTKDEEVDRLILCWQHAKPITQNLYSLDAQIKAEMALPEFNHRVILLATELATEPDTPLNDADHVGLFNSKEDV